MLNTLMHRRGMRTLVAVFFQLINATAVNLLLVPLHLYSGGLTGLCQLIRTLLVDGFNLDLGNHDIAGILYFIINIPIFLVALKILGLNSITQTLVCVFAYSFFTSIIPIPAQPIVGDYLTACLLRGIVSGIAAGFFFTCGGSNGGLDLIGLCITKYKVNFTIGRFGMLINGILYGTCLFLFDPEIAIYSIISNFTMMYVIDRFYQQSVTVQALVFTRQDDHAISRLIIEKMKRTVTYWDARGAYTDENIHVLCVCITNFEVDELLHLVHSVDPHAFVTTQSHLKVYGNFPRKPLGM